MHSALALVSASARAARDGRVAAEISPKFWGIRG